MLKWFRRPRYKNRCRTSTVAADDAVDAIGTNAHVTTTVDEYVCLCADRSVRLVPSAMTASSDRVTRDRAHRVVLDRAAEFGPLRVFVDLSECSLCAVDIPYYKHLSGWLKREYRDRLQTLTLYCPHKRHLWIVFLMRQLLGSGTRSKVRIVRNLPGEITTTNPRRPEIGAAFLRLARAACVVWTARRFPRATWFGLVWKLRS